MSIRRRFPFIKIQDLFAPSRIFLLQVRFFNKLTLFLALRSLLVSMISTIEQDQIVSLYRSENFLLKFFLSLPPKSFERIVSSFNRSLSPLAVVRLEIREPRKNIGHVVFALLIFRLGWFLYCRTALRLAH